MRMLLLLVFLCSCNRKQVEGAIIYKKDIDRSEKLCKNDEGVAYVSIKRASMIEDHTREMRMVIWNEVTCVNHSTYYYKTEGKNYTMFRLQFWSEVWRKI